MSVAGSCQMNEILILDTALSVTICMIFYDLTPRLPPVSYYAVITVALVCRHSAPDSIKSSSSPQSLAMGDIWSSSYQQADKDRDYFSDLENIWIVGVSRRNDFQCLCDSIQV